SRAAGRRACRAARQSTEPSLVHVAGAMIDELLFVLSYPSVELVDERVDGGVHVLLDGIRVDLPAIDVYRGLGLVPQLLDPEDAMHVRYEVEVPFDLLDLVADITPQRRGDFQLVARNTQLHLVFSRICYLR